MIIGFSVAAPVGPIGILVIQRSLQEGRWQGFITGMGAALADSVYGMIAGLGLTVVASFLLEYSFALKLVGGIFLLCLGGQTFLSSPAEKEADTQSTQGKALSHLSSTFFLTITNPLTILAFLGIFAALGLGSQTPQLQDALTLVLGVFLGSALWWFLLTFLVDLFRSKLESKALGWINKISGLVLLAFGVGALVSTL